MKKLTFLFIFIIFFIYSFFNLGNFLDISEQPSKTELLVCLGGGEYKTRIEKTTELYNNNFLTTNKIILTSQVIDRKTKEDKRITYIKNYLKDYSKVNIIQKKELPNTAEEIRFIKTYMIKNNLQTATFISDPAHSRRIQIFTKIISVKGDENLSFQIVGTDDKNWDKESFYKNKYSLNYTLFEILKISYGVIRYGVLEKIGLDAFVKEYFSDEIYFIKKFMERQIYSIKI